MEDLRIAILRYFKEQNHSTEEHPSNEWLQKQHEDLGSLRRALIELIDDDFLIISNENKEMSIRILHNEYNTTTTSNPLNEQDKLKKSSKRLIMDLPPFKKIREHKFITTIKGINFLIEFDKLNVDATLSKWQKKWFWPIAIIGAASLVISILSLVISPDWKKQSQEPPTTKEQPLLKNKKTAR